MTNQDGQGIFGEQGTILQAFSRALARETHVLIKEPDLLWQQLYNRLQWEGLEVSQALAPELAQRSATGARPWLRLDTPYRDSKGLIRTLSGHTAEVTSCACMPDGSLILSASRDGTVRVWDAASGQPLRTLVGHNTWVRGCAFSPDGRFIVSAGDSLRIWDVASGQQLRNMEIQNEIEDPIAYSISYNYPFEACSFSPDGRLIVSAGEDRKLRIWEVATGQVLRTIEDATNPCALSPNGCFIVASRGLKLEVWETTSGQALCTLEGHHEAVLSCAYSLDGRYILSASKDKTLRVWEAGTGQLVRTLEGHTSYVTSCAFSPDGRFIVSASQDKTLRVWSAATGQPLRTLEGHTKGVTSCAFSPDGCYLVSASQDKTLRVWEFDIEEPSAITKGHTQKVDACIFSPDGHLLFSVSNEDRLLQVWESATGQVLHTIEDAATPCAFSPDGRFIVASRGLKLQVWEANSGQMLYTLEGHTKGLSSCAYSPDGRYILSTSQDETLRVWDAGTGQLVRTLVGHTSYVNACAFSPDGRFIVSASNDETLRVWETATGQTLHNLKGHTSFVNACTYSPDGRFILSASWDDTLRVWVAATGQLYHTLKGHPTRLLGCAYSPDGRYILSTSDYENFYADKYKEKTFIVWEAATGHPMYILEGHTNRVNSCAFSPDGLFIVSASQDNTLRVWQIDNGENLASLSLPGAIHSLGLHPSAARMACGDEGGAVYLLESSGFEYGPFIATAWRLTLGSFFRKSASLAFGCPHCRTWSEIPKSALDSEISCPNCGKTVKINPFTIQGNWKSIAKAWQKGENKR